MNSVKILDCTLRDGGYCNQWKFGFENEKKIINGLIEANIDIVECGLLVDEPYIKGISKFCNVEQTKEVIPENKKETLFVCLMNYGNYDIKKIPIYDGKTIDGIRVAFHKKDMVEALEVCKEIKRKGYKVFVQPMVSLAYSEEVFRELIECVNELEPYAFYLVDSFGMMKRKDMIRLFNIIENNLKKGIQIGFHSHNNLQLAYANAQALVDLSIEHSLIIDACIMGMGRGAGNLNTELFLEHLNDNLGKKYEVRPILRVIDEVLNIFYKKNYWGYSLPNYLSAFHNAHPNYALFLADKNTLTVENMNEIFSLMDESEKSEFNKQYVESLYLNYMEKNQSISKEGVEAFSEKVREKEILLIAPGKSSEEEYEKIIKFIFEKNIMCISINFEYTHYDTDYIFISNLRRFQEINMNKKNKMIVTSNIDTEETYLRVNYKDLLNEVESVRDNATMMLIKLLINYGVKKIYLAGVDGYSHDENENYAEEYLQLVTRNSTLDVMNKGMNDMIKKFANECDISFVTTCKNIGV